MHRQTTLVYFAVFQANYLAANAATTNGSHLSTSTERTTGRKSDGGILQCDKTSCLHASVQTSGKSVTAKASKGMLILVAGPTAPVRMTVLS